MVRGREPDPAQAAGLIVFYGDHDRDLVAVAAATTRGDAADHRLVELHDPGQLVAFRADHGPAHLVHPGPRRLVAAEPEDPLQPEG
jgi:hypothetical protein